ncbi:MAG: hypothetical protein EHM28_01860 [Spirochaetaceae bacterium]|nr:MAG: hypothetical protein EHM28_01860 [Spirochaetaceae bacterium]
MGELVARNEMSKQLIKGVGGVGAGIALWIVSGLLQGPWLWIAAGVCGVIGIGMLISKSDKKAGMAMLGAGALVAVAIVGGLVPWLLPVAGIGLIALGGYSIFKFFSNLKKRT